MNVATYRLLTLIHEFDQRLGWNDGGCRFPGCSARQAVDAHHIRHWADGGETSMDNLLLLRRHHHKLVHEGDYGLALDEPGEAVFRTPDGNAIATGLNTRFSGNAFALTAINCREGIGIDPRTLVPYWCEERMDDGIAVEGLVRRE